MPLKAPAFWQQDGPIARFLAPLGYAYGLAGALRWWRCPRVNAPVPVLCVGNVTVGGTGKTPIVLDLLERLRRRGLDAHGLCRGHGGRLPGPVRVDPNRHRAQDVGDEALLLAERAPTWAGPDRLAGAEAAARAGAEVLVLDDGLQYPRLAKTASLLVVDAATGFGNGRIVPAGPLREPPTRAFERVEAVAVVGAGSFRVEGLPSRLRDVWRCRLVSSGSADALRGRRFVAFAGIGRPEKFFATARELGARLVATRAFADHHLYRPGELADLQTLARSADARLLTTTKDAVRLPPGELDEVDVLPVAVQWADDSRIDAWLDQHVCGLSRRK